ncbi:unnamed protein product, partial [marine sediment metagenome]
AASWNNDGSSGDEKTLSVYKFDGTTDKSAYVDMWDLGPTAGMLLHEVASQLVTSLGRVMVSISWSPDGRYIATASTDLVAQHVQVFSFDGGFIGTPDLGLTIADSSRPTIDWSPIGRFIVLANTTSIGVLYFGDDQSLHLPGSAYLLTSQQAPLTPVVWSPDGKYVGYAFFPDVDTPYTGVIRFNGTALVDPIFKPTDPLSEVPINSIDWSACGKWIVTGGDWGTYGVLPERSLVVIQQAMTCPENCVVKNCTIADVHA